MPITTTIILLGFLLMLSSQAVSVGEKSEDNSIATQLEAFDLHEDFEINLFADESLGIANPIAIHWDDRGRLWVLTTLTYAQLEPGENPNDTLVILEDTDEDGVADKSTVFADGLEMPMGFALGQGGVYLGEGPDLLFLTDTDGDDRADTRKVLLTGFGTGDTHQNISNFTWGPQGRLYFSQGLHCYSRVETPWGIVRGDAAGFWRLDVESLRLEPFCFSNMASMNPCGIAFDKSGALFVKSNNQELFYATPGLVPTTHPKNLVPITSIGRTPGKSMGGEHVASDHLPDWLQNHILIAGYYANRVTAFPLIEEGAGYARVEPREILRSSHTSFRPVDIRIGPDGAIYVTDWFNPIIGHYQASLRHPDRDEKHGRIWRITAWDRPLGKGKATIRVPVSDISSDKPRERLAAILEAADEGTPAAIGRALEALDAPRDRFIDYALEQTLHAHSARWLGAAIAEGWRPERPEHLLFALETQGDVGIGIAREEWKRDDLDSQTRAAFAGLVARGGDPEDIMEILSGEIPTIEILQSLASINESSVSANAEIESRLRELLGQSEGEALRLLIAIAGRWGVTSLADRIDDLAKDPQQSIAVRRGAIVVLGQDFNREISFFLSNKSAEIRHAAIEALSTRDLKAAATAAAADLQTVSSAEEAGFWLRPFLRRTGGLVAIADALSYSGISKKAAGILVTAINERGRNDEALLAVLHDTMGIQSGDRAWSASFVADLVAEIETSGDAAKGKAIYQRAERTCLACHQIGGVGGVTGPSLDAVGAGLSTDLLVESVLWPQRQLKEGYFAASLITRDGDQFVGYRESAKQGEVAVRDPATNEMTILPRGEIAKIHEIGSLMPAGLTAALSREELRDLIAWLASLKG